MFYIWKNKALHRYEFRNKNKLFVYMQIRKLCYIFKHLFIIFLINSNKFRIFNIELNTSQDTETLIKANICSLLVKSFIYHFL